MIARIARLFLFFALGVSIFADVIASDLPIIMRFRSELFVLPAISQPASLRAMNNRRIRQSFRTGDWAIFPIVEFGPNEQPPIKKPPPAAPDNVHFLGTDDRGRDVLARMIHGMRASVYVASVALLITLFIGLILGVVGGYLGGLWDSVVNRMTEFTLALPTFLIVLAVIGLIDKSSALILATLIGVTSWPTLTRIIRAETQSLSKSTYVSAARISGGTHLNIVLRHILPNLRDLLIINMAFGFARVILIESSLSFLGFGIAPPQASLGGIIAQGLAEPDAWWLVIAPGLLIFLLSWSLFVTFQKRDNRVGTSKWSLLN